MSDVQASSPAATPAPTAAQDVQAAAASVAQAGQDVGAAGSDMGKAVVAVAADAKADVAKLKALLHL